MSVVFRSSLNNLPKVWICIFLLLSKFECIGQSHTAVNKVKTGAYVTDLYDFDIEDGTFSVDFWFWTLSKSNDFDFEHHTEILKSKDVRFEGTFFNTYSGEKFSSAKIKTKVRQTWDLRNYPFDKQTLKLSIESAEEDYSKLRFVLDEDESKLSEYLPQSLNEWDILESRFYVDSNSYQTGYGNPTLKGKSIFSTYNFEIDVERKGSMLIFFKFITGLLVAFVISISTFLIKPIHTDPRFGLCVGGLFASIGNKYIIESVVPSTNQYTLLDKLHNLTFVFLFFIVLTSVISLRIYEREKEKSHLISKSIDATALVVFSVVYFSLATYIVL
jgi:hypothetical protein